MNYNEAAYTDARLEEEIRKELARELYRQARLSIPAMLLVLLLTGRVLGTEVLSVPPVSAIFYSLMGLAVLRWILVVWGLQERGPWASGRFLESVFAAGSLLMGLGIASLCILTYDRLSPLQIAMLIVIQAAIQSAGLITMATSRASFFCYMMPIYITNIALVWRDPRPWDSADLLLLLVFFSIAVSLLILQQYRNRRMSLELSLKNSEAAICDSLTGLRNRRFLQAFMETEVEQSLRDALFLEGDPPAVGFALLMLDLDHFKEVNDLYGHAVGDKVLRQCAGVLRETARKSDVLVRWGGEEFVVVARIQEREAAQPAAERFLQQLQAEQYLLPDGSHIQVTCSIGYTIFPFYPDRPELLNWERSLSLADSGLYEAKQRGRDQVVGMLPGSIAGMEDHEILEALHQVQGALARGLVKLQTTD